MWSHKRKKDTSCFLVSCDASIVKTIAPTQVISYHSHWAEHHLPSPETPSKYPKNPSFACQGSARKRWVFGDRDQPFDKRGFHILGASKASARMTKRRLYAEAALSWCVK
jgi:hypothetical protein